MFQSEKVKSIIDSMNNTSQIAPALNDIHACSTYLAPSSVPKCIDMTQVKPKFKRKHC